MGEVGVTEVYSTKGYSLPLVSFPCAVRFEECPSTEVVANKVRVEGLALAPLVPSSNTFLQPLDMLRVGHWSILPLCSTCASGCTSSNQSGPLRLRRKRDFLPFVPRGAASSDSLSVVLVTFAA